MATDSEYFKVEIVANRFTHVAYQNALRHIQRRYVYVNKKEKGGSRLELGVHNHVNGALSNKIARVQDEPGGPFWITPLYSCMLQFELNKKKGKESRRKQKAVVGVKMFPKKQRGEGR